MLIVVTQIGQKYNYLKYLFRKDRLYNLKSSFTIKYYPAIKIKDASLFTTILVNLIIYYFYMLYTLTMGKWNIMQNVNNLLFLIHQLYKEEESTLFY